MSLKYAVVFEGAPENWGAYVPDLLGCISTGDTLAEAETNIREAIGGHLRALRDFGARFRCRRVPRGRSRLSRRFDSCESSNAGRYDKAMKFLVSIYKDEDGAFIAECPAIPGCVSQGRTEAEAEVNISDAIRECLTVRAEMSIR
jgi:predicted RNase H-like HicB family nuclease